MAKQFKTIGVLARQSRPGIDVTLLSLGRFLAERGHEILLEDDIAAQLPDWTHRSATLATIGKKSDLIIVVGGDGTLLRAARELAGYNTPLLGINLGRLGFLTDVSPDNMLDTLVHILSGDFEEEHRFLLQTEIGAPGQSPCTALNDVVIHKWNVARMIEFETYVDGRFVEAQRSDGLIIATPTGSTAYALSGGGPLLAPTLNAIVMVPICPHTLSNRPIVVGGDCKIEILICGRTTPDQVRVTCDGHTSLTTLDPGDPITIKKHAHPIRLLHPSGHDHFSILRAKLGWSEHPV